MYMLISHNIAAVLTRILLEDCSIWATVGSRTPTTRRWWTQTAAGCRSRRSRTRPQRQSSTRWPFGRAKSQCSTSPSPSRRCTVGRWAAISSSPGSRSSRNWSSSSSSRITHWRRARRLNHNPNLSMKSWLNYNPATPFLCMNRLYTSSTSSIYWQL